MVNSYHRWYFLHSWAEHAAIHVKFFANSYHNCYLMNCARITQIRVNSYHSCYLIHVPVDNRRWRIWVNLYHCCYLTWGSCRGNGAEYTVNSYHSWYSTKWHRGICEWSEREVIAVTRCYSTDNPDEWMDEYHRVNSYHRCYSTRVNWEIYHE